MTEDKELEQYNIYVNSPFERIKDYFWMWVQEVLPEYENLLLECRRTWEYDPMKLYMFKPFKRYQMITWQQAEIFHAVTSAIRWEKPKKIAIRSWHGVWKSSSLSRVILWYLFAHYRSIVWCTAPTSDQMYDVLRKELAIRIWKLPPEIKPYFRRSRKYIRIVDPNDTTVYDDEDESNEWNTRFARARTASKDRPEALAWLHADDLMLLWDEASGIDDAVREYSKWALTNDNTLLVMISNPTRTEWYFYDAFHNLSSTFQTLHFNSEQSPIVWEWFIEDIKLEHGEDSDEYKIRVRGDFPDHWDLDDEWWMDLFNLDKIDFIPEEEANIFNPTRMWIDPSKEWVDKCPRACRDELILRIVAEKTKNTEKSIANMTATLLYTYDKIDTQDVVYDNFGVWANVWTELALAWYKCTWVNGSDTANDSNTFENIRAEMYWRFAQWLKNGWQLVWDRKYRDDLKMIKYKRNWKWKIQIIPKEKIKKRYWKSPDRPDAASYTFYRLETKAQKKEKEPRNLLNPLTWEKIQKNDFSRNNIDLW